MASAASGAVALRSLVGRGGVGGGSSSSSRWLADSSGWARRLLRYAQAPDRCGRAYSYSLRADVVSAGVLGALGDLICQVGAEGTPLAELDKRRLAALGVFSSAYIGVFCHHLYKMYPVAVSATATVGGGWRSGSAGALARRRGHMRVGGGGGGGGGGGDYLRFHTRLARTARHQTAGSGLGCALLDNAHNGMCYTPAYFLGVGLLQGDGLEQAMDNLRQQWGDAYAMATAFWLPFMWLNFRFVPSAHRVRAMATANLVWSVAIDCLAHRHPADVSVEPSDIGKGTD